MHRSRLRRVFFASCLILLPIVVSYQLAELSDVDGHTEGALHVEDSVWEFGTFSSTGTYYHEFKIVNHTRVPVALTGFTSSCGCAVATLPDAPIGRDDSGLVKVALKPAERSGPYKGEVVIWTDHPTHQYLTMSLRGTIEHLGGRIIVFPRELFFETVVGKGPEEKRLMIERVGKDSELDFLAASSDISELNVLKADEPELSLPNRNGHIEFFVSIPDGLPVGKVSGTINISTGHENNPTIGIPVHIIVLPVVEAYPEKLYLSADSTGAAAGRIRLRNRLGLPLSRENVHIPEILLGAANTVQVDESTIDLTFKLTSVSRKIESKWLSVFHDGSDSEDMKIPISFLTKQGFILH